MYQLLIKTFIRDYKNTEDAHVREQYGTVCSIISIVCNIILVVFKLIFGTLVHSRMQEVTLRHSLALS